MLMLSVVNSLSHFKETTQNTQKWETYHYSRQSMLRGRRSRYSCSIQILAVSFDLDLDFQSLVSYGQLVMTHTCKKSQSNQGQRSVSSKVRVERDEGNRKSWIKQWISNKRYHNIKLHQKLNTLQAENCCTIFILVFIIMQHLTRHVLVIRMTNRRRI